jgi:transcription initiation factor TFIID subunit 2
MLTGEQYSDARYLSTVIVALGAALVPGRPPERGILTEAEGPAALSEADARILDEAVQEVDRYRLRDQYVSSQHNVVTSAALEFKLMLMLGGVVPTDGNFFLEYTREENFTPVRLAAFDALLVMKWYARPALIRYFFSVVISDPSRTVRRHLSHAMVESLGLMYHINELGAAHKKEPLLIEEDGREKKPKKGSEGSTMIRVLRKELHKSATFRDCILPAMQ